jgi:hypothetical protein
MSFSKRNKQIDGLVNTIEDIKSMSQCSLSVTDLTVLNDAIEKLQKLKRKKGLINKHLQPQVVEIVELITFYLVNQCKQTSI